MLKILLGITLTCFFTDKAYSQYPPKYIAWVGGKVSGSIKRGEFLAQQGVAAERWIAGNHWEHIKVDSFTISVLRDSLMILYYKNRGQVFEDTLKVLLKALKINDRILIFNIYASTYPELSVYLSPLEYKIE